ncbi:LSMT-L [Symbiodinium sp. CCMP2592]|nr:LSMT-L [Symbiodinium sp. CCMP2592]
MVSGLAWLGRGPVPHRSVKTRLRVRAAGSLSQLPELSKLFDYLEQSGASGLQDVEPRASTDSAAGYGLFAKRPFRRGELVVSIPRAVCLRASEESSELSADLAAAAALLRERAKTDSVHKAYLETLPAISAQRHPATWPASRRWKEFFQGSPRGLRRVRLARMRALAAIDHLRNDLTVSEEQTA